MTTANPRQAAFEILTRIEKEKSYADILIDRELAQGSLQGPDRGLLTELVYGILRRQGTLDHVINQFSKQKADRLERAVCIILRLGIYQLLFLDRIPVHAAVNETVNLAKRLAPRAANFVNAILRRTDRERDAIPYPDKATDPAGFLAQFYSHPRWLVEGWLEQLGFAEAEALAAAMARPAPLTLRVNSLKTSREQLLAALADADMTAEPTSCSPYGINISGHLSVASLEPFRSGLCTVQDESSQLAALFLDPKPGDRVLDVCAAPGGKATFLAQLMENRGSLLACDITRRKLGMIEEGAARLGLDIISTELMDATLPPKPLEGKKFDRVLVDAPCSGLGVIRRNPEGKWWKTQEDVLRQSAKQKAILRNLADTVESGGTLVYSTCSTTVAENEAVVCDFLGHRHDFVLEDLRELFPQFAQLCTTHGYFRAWPHRHGMDGFFAARMRRL